MRHLGTNLPLRIGAKIDNPCLQRDRCSKIWANEVLQTRARLSSVGALEKHALLGTLDWLCSMVFACCSAWSIVAYECGIHFDLYWPKKRCHACRTLKSFVPQVKGLASTDTMKRGEWVCVANDAVVWSSLMLTWPWKVIDLENGLASFGVWIVGDSRYENLIDPNIIGWTCWVHENFQSFESGVIHWPWACVSTQRSMAWHD